MRLYKAVLCTFLTIMMFFGISKVFATDSFSIRNAFTLYKSEELLSSIDTHTGFIEKKISEILQTRRQNLIINKVNEIKEQKRQEQADEEQKILEIESKEKVNFLSNLGRTKEDIIQAKVRSDKIKAKFLAENIELNSASELISYPDYLDISGNLPYMRIQEKSLSCELSATSDILSYLENTNISEISVINDVDKSMYNQSPGEENGVTIWGNPNAGYVGNIDTLPNGDKATQSGMTGYGVLEKPIAKIYDKYNYTNTIITNKDYQQDYSQRQHLTELLQNLNAGNMIQLWADYCTTPEYEDTENINTCSRLTEDRTLTWYYKENGELIKHEGLAGEHAFYLLGYKGGVENPTDIIVWDTLTGKHTYPIKEWMRKWNKMENKSIIIYK